MEFYFVITMALAAYGAEHDIPHLILDQWDLVEKIVAVLNPIKELRSQYQQK